MHFNDSSSFGDKSRYSPTPITNAKRESKSFVASGFTEIHFVISGIPDIIDRNKDFEYDVKVPKID